MNKFQTIITVCCGIALIAGCGNIKPETERSAEITEARYIGQKHNEMLDTFFSNCRSARCAGNSSSWQHEFRQMFPDIPEENIISVTQKEQETQSPLIDVLSRHELLNAEAETYIREIDALLADPPDTLAELETRFGNIENRLSDETMPADATAQVRSYVETARASLRYWTANLDCLSEEFLGKPQEMHRAIDRESIKAWWTANKRKIGMCVASDATGAAAGAAAGLAAAAAGGGAAIPAAAILGAIAAGTASSIQGFMTESFVVVLPMLTNGQNAPQ